MLRINFKYVAAFFAATFLCAVSFFQLSFAKDAPLDVRFVIDISGSMKETDPNNLRVTAVNMISQMIPDGSKSGVWTFASYANMLIKHGVVDDEWKANASAVADKINSVGAWTNIGRALETVTWDKSNFQPNTHIIFLTDGKVDIGPDDTKDATERQRILNDLLPKLKNKNYKFHTIALSDLSDKAFLKELSYTTGGHYTVANNADTLIQAFLKAFDGAVPTNQVPIKGNKFEIDESVKEFTVLAFKKSNHAPTRLIAPSGSVFKEIDHPAYVTWFEDPMFDLITITAPMDGEWEIVADIDPANRVTVVSDLALTMTTLPSLMLDGEAVEIIATLTEGDQNIEDKSFLKLVTMNLAHTLPDSTQHARAMQKVKVHEKSQYKMMFGKLQHEGIHQIKIVADGKTFKRQNTQQVNFIKPVDIKIFDLTQRDGKLAGIKVKPSNEGIDIDSMKVASYLTSPEGEVQETALSINAQSIWSTELKAEKGPGTYKVVVKVTGRTQGGKAFEVESPMETLVVQGAGASAETAASDATLPEETATQDLASDAISGIPQEGADPVEQIEEPMPAPVEDAANEKVAEPEEEFAIEEVVIQEETMLENNAVAEDITELAEESTSSTDYVLYGLLSFVGLSLFVGIVMLLLKHKNKEEDDGFLKLPDDALEDDGDIQALSKEMSEETAINDPYLQDDLSDANDSQGLDIDNNIDQMLSEASTDEENTVEETSEEPSWDEAFEETEPAQAESPEAAVAETPISESVPEEEPSWDEAFEETEPAQAESPEAAVAEAPISEPVPEEEPSWDEAFEETEPAGVEALESEPEPEPEIDLEVEQPTALEKQALQDADLDDLLDSQEDDADSKKE